MKATHRILFRNHHVVLVSFSSTRPTMERVEKTVFLSYRRTNIPWALAIFQNLTQQGFDVFIDYTGIASGDFEQTILGNITARAHFLVLLTPSALERCNDPEDWLRREIETALDTHRNIIPLMLEGFDFGTPKIATQLTGKLATLKHYQGLSIPPEYFLEAMGRLRDRYLNVPLKAVLHPASPPAEEAATEQKAEAHAAPVVQEEELTAQQWFERGFAAADPDEQLRFYSNAIRLKPDYTKAFNNRGNARLARGHAGSALQDYSEAIRLNPGDGGVVYNRGLARRKMGDLEGALKDLSEAIRLKPNYSSAFDARGLARFEKGDLEGALKDFNEAIRIDPDNANAFNNRGFACQHNGDLDSALQDYNRSIELEPTFAEAFDNRSLARRAKGDLDGAKQDHDEAIRLGFKPEE